MEQEISSALADLTKRTEHLEHIHPDFTMTTEGVVHSVFSNLPSIILSVALSAGVGLLIAYGVNKYQK